MSVKSRTNNPAVLAVPSAPEVPEDTFASGVAGKTARLTLRNGSWYADGVCVDDYRKALKLTLQTAAITAQPKLPATTRKSRKPKPVPIPERLEARAWWPEFVRDHLERKARNAAADRYDALFKKRRDWEAQRHALWIAHTGTDPNAPSPTLRERALVALANSRGVPSERFSTSSTRSKAVSA